MSEVVTLARQGAVAVVRVNNPPVNALGVSVRSGLQNSLNAAEADPEVQGIVLVCDGNTCRAGAAMKEFGKPPQSRRLREGVNEIEAGSKPSIAVIHGTALGGGREVALSCHYRIA